jgi:hypothetical protein
MIRWTQAFVYGLAMTILAGSSAWSGNVRDPFRQPFATTSLWNRGLGRGAVWSRRADEDTQDLIRGEPALNAAIWSMPYFLARRGDPLLTFDVSAPRGDGTIKLFLRAPRDIHPAGPPDGDRHIILFDPNRRWMYHLLGCAREPAGFRCTLWQKDDVCRDGLGGYGWGTGVLRVWELKRGEIDHMLRYALPVSATRSRAEVGHDAWPAQGEDSFGPERYTGHVLFGSTIGLPKDVDLGKLQLSKPGYAFAKALQTYGALQRDTGGEKGIIFYAEEAAASLPELAAIQADLPKIVPHLRILRNQSPATPNGGGGALVGPVPPLDPHICPR